MVNTNTAAGKDFVQFKRNLYKMYEVRNRSVLEHEAFSMTIDRRNLKSLYKSNLDFVENMRYEVLKNGQDQLATNFIDLHK
jgi:Fe-S cluster assembly iron-binding protein IscA